MKYGEYLNFVKENLDYFDKLYENDVNSKEHSDVVLYVSDCCTF